MGAKKSGDTPRPRNWEYGTKAERRKRLDDAIRFLAEGMKELEYLAVGEAGPIAKGKKKPRWNFGP